MKYRYTLDSPANASLIEVGDGDRVTVVCQMTTGGLPKDDRPPIEVTAARICGLLNGEPAKPAPTPDVVREALRRAHEHWDDEPWLRREASNIAANALAALDASPPEKVVGYGVMLLPVELKHAVFTLQEEAEEFARDCIRMPCRIVKLVEVEVEA